MATEKPIDTDHDFDVHSIPVFQPQPGEQEQVHLTAHIGPAGPLVELVVNGQVALVSLHDLLLEVSRIGLETGIDLDGRGA